MYHSQRTCVQRRLFLWSGICVLCLCFFLPAILAQSSNNGRRKPAAELKELLREFERVQGDTKASQLTLNEKRSWCDKLLNAAGTPPTTSLEASVLLEAALLTGQLDEPEKSRALLLEIAENENSGFSNQMRAAQHVIGFWIDGTDPSLMIRALDAYSNAATQREHASPTNHRDEYQKSTDPMIQATAYHRGRAWLGSALHASAQDPARSALARSAIREFDAYFASAPASEAVSGFIPPLRYVYFQKGLALAMIGDQASLRETVLEMQTKPFKNPINLLESAGYLLYQACLQSSAHGLSSENAPQGDSRTNLAAQMRKYEQLIRPDDRYYVEYQRQIILADHDEHNWNACLERIENLLNTQIVSVTDYLESKPRIHSNLLYLQGDCLVQLDRMNEARSVFELLIDRFPNDSDSLLARSRVEKGW